MMRWLLGATVFALAITGQETAQAPSAQAASAGVLSQISAAALRGDVSFLASDALEGRATPSKGQDVAAEFLASRFRAAGLEPIGAEGSYFQEAKFVEVTPKLSDVQLTLVTEGNELKLGSEDVAVQALAAIEVQSAPVVDLPEEGPLPDVAGKVVAGVSQVYGTEDGLIRLQNAKPALILLAGKRRGRGASYLEEAGSQNAPVIRLANEDALEAVKAGKSLTVSVHASAPEKKEITLRNVGGVLRGSDAALRDEYVLLSAHYDHVGTKTGSGDTIFNGANDNASGTASVVEIAAALTKLPAHPKRSILFVLWFGEERGLLGSYYYARHPIVPLTKTIAGVNLEQMGRTDDKEGARVRSMSFTGPAYSDLPARMADAAKTVDVSVYEKKDADSFFARSDNLALALAGVVAHTVCVAFEYPDYHAVGDEWQKLNYENMAAVDRGVALGIIQLADNPVPPKWNPIDDTARYRPAAVSP